jgi:hypothetical protein
MGGTKQNGIWKWIRDYGDCISLIKRQKTNLKAAPYPKGDYAVFKEYWNHQSWKIVKKEWTKIRGLYMCGAKF